MKNEVNMKDVKNLNTVDIYDEANKEKIATGRTVDDISTANTIRVTDIIHVDGYQGNITLHREYILKVGSTVKGVICNGTIGNSATFQ